MKMKLVVLVNEDLYSLPYKAVQAGHAVAQFLLDHPDSNWKNDTLIYLSANKYDMLSYIAKADIRKLEHSAFYEPDIGNELTACAIHCDEGNMNLCHKFKLLRL